METECLNSSHRGSKQRNDGLDFDVHTAGVLSFGRTFRSLLREITGAHE